MNIAVNQPEHDDKQEAERYEAMNYFLSSFLSQVSERLDYSPTSLRIVGEWLLSRYENYEITQDETNTELLFGAVCYVGETYRKSLGGYWAILPGEPELGHSYIDAQVIAGIDKYDAEAIIRPALEFRETLKDRIEAHLEEQLEALIRHYRKKLSQQTGSQSREEH